MHNTARAIGDFNAAFREVARVMAAPAGRSRLGVIIFLTLLVLVAPLLGALTTAVIVDRYRGTAALPRPAMA